MAVLVALEGVAAKIPIPRKKRVASLVVVVFTPAFQAVALDIEKVLSCSASSSSMVTGLEYR